MAEYAGYAWVIAVWVGDIVVVVFSAEVVWSVLLARTILPV